AARERRDNRTYRPRKNYADRGDHEGAGEEQPEDTVSIVRFDRQRTGREGARDHDRDGARGIRDEESTLRARGLPGTRGLHKKHDQGSGAYGRAEIGGGGDRRADAADQRAHTAGETGGSAGDGGVHEQGRRGGRCGVVGPGGAGSERAADELWISRRRHPDREGKRAWSVERRGQVGEDGR